MTHHTPQETADLILSNDEWANMKADTRDLAQSHNALLAACEKFVDRCDKSCTGRDTDGYKMARTAIKQAKGL